MAHDIVLGPVDLQQAAARWRATLDAYLAYQPTFTAAENERIRTRDEETFEPFRARLDGLHQAVEEARLAAYRTPPRTLREVVALAELMRVEEGAVFEENGAFAEGFDNLIASLRALLPWP